MDVACTWECEKAFRDARNAKLNKYKPLAVLMRQTSLDIYKKIHVTTLIMGVRGGWCQHNNETLNHLRIWGPNRKSHNREALKLVMHGSYIVYGSRCGTFLQAPAAAAQSRTARQTTSRPSILAATTHDAGYRAGLE